MLEYWGKNEHLWWRQNGTRKEWKEREGRRSDGAMVGKGYKGHAHDAHGNNMNDKMQHGKHKAMLDMTKMQHEMA